MKKTALLQRWQHVFHWLMIQCVPWECLGCLELFLPLTWCQKKLEFSKTSKTQKEKHTKNNKHHKNDIQFVCFFFCFLVIYAILGSIKKESTWNTSLVPKRLSRHRQGSIKGHFAFSQQALQWVQRFQRHFARRKNARTVGLEKQRGDLWRRCFWLRFKSGWMVARWGLLRSDGKIWVAVDPGYWLFFFFGGFDYPAIWRKIS